MMTGPVYDANGNITQKSDVGSVFKYNHPIKPYALTGIETTTALVPQVLQEVSYTSFEQPSVITESPYQATFLYNSDEQRARMEVKQNGSTILTRWYAGSRYMKETAGSTTREYTWIGGDAYTAPCVAVKTNTGSQVYYYLLRDYLGNITHQVNMSNTVVAEYSFDSWGRRRNKDWTYSLAGEPELLAGRGFTGHEWLPWFNLYNMNGRLYDPVVGRFLSPDNYVQMPDNTQNFNRYSYALNNPLVYTDPDGEIIEWILLGVGAYIGGAIANKSDEGRWQFNPTRWEPNLKTFGYMIGGAAIGYMGGAAIEGLFTGTTTLNAGLTYENLASVFTEINLSGAGPVLEGIGYATLAGGGAFIAGSSLNKMFSRSQSITISTSTPFDGNGLRGGYGISVGQFEGIDSQGLFLTTFKGEGISLNLSLDNTYYQPLLDRPVNIHDLNGSGYSLDFGLAFLGYSHGNNGYVEGGQGFHYIPPTYRSHTISVSYGMHIGYANWETTTRVLPLPKWLYKILYPL